jgi:hypothetical protein
VGWHAPVDEQVDQRAKDFLLSVDKEPRGGRLGWRACQTPHAKLSAGQTPNRRSPQTIKVKKFAKDTHLKLFRVVVSTNRTE